ncbi:hypothetical protein ABW20_dc0106019 [Dactylellina cionopaga]|nr:hypothetical protein ABW20_dc0106019 [Dactylellina cionopaga]
MDSSETTENKLAETERKLVETERQLKETTDRLQAADAMADTYKRENKALEVKLENWEKKYQEADKKRIQLQKQMAEFAASLENV